MPHHVPMSQDISIRKATVEDAPFVTLAMIEAIGDSIMERYEANGCSTAQADMKRMELLTPIVRRTDTLYSWTHSIVACNPAGEPVGALISYPGDNYMTMRRLTFHLAGSFCDFDTETMDAEVNPDEYYLDSLAVLPRYRKQGIARRLLQYGIEQGKSMHRTTVPACAPENTNAKALYESLGFTEDGHLFIFGEDYLRMIVEP